MQQAAGACRWRPLALQHAMARDSRQSCRMVGPTLDSRPHRAKAGTLLRRDAVEIEVQEPLGIGLECHSGVGGLSLYGARESLFVHCDRHRFRLAQSWIDHHGDRHGVKENGRGRVPKVIEKGQRVGSGRQVRKDAVPPVSFELQHSAGIERHHEDQSLSARLRIRDFISESADSMLKPAALE